MTPNPQAAIARLPEALERPMTDPKEHGPVELLRSNAKSRRALVKAIMDDIASAQRKLHDAANDADEWDRAADLLEAAMSASKGEPQ